MAKCAQIALSKLLLLWRSTLLATGNELTAIPLPANNSITQADTAQAPKALEQIERAYIIQILKMCRAKISGKHGATYTGLLAPGSGLMHPI